MNHFIQHFQRTGGSALCNALSKSNRFIHDNGRKDEKELYDLIINSKIENPIVVSHFLFGLTNDLLKAKYYTILRNPIHSAISCWILHYNNKHMYAHTQAVENSISNFMLATVDNQFCRFLLGKDGKFYYRKELIDSDIDRCIDILFTYELVGDYDQYDNFIKQLSKKVDFNIELYKMKITHSEYFPIERSEYNKLKDLLRFDCAIYEKLFNKEPVHKYFKD